jgi:hypothetical protein
MGKLAFHKVGFTLMEKREEKWRLPEEEEYSWNLKMPGRFQKPSLRFPVIPTVVGKWVKTAGDTFTRRDIFVLYRLKS